MDALEYSSREHTAADFGDCHGCHSNGVGTRYDGKREERRGNAKAAKGKKIRAVYKELWVIETKFSIVSALVFYLTLPKRIELRHAMAGVVSPSFGNRAVYIMS